MQGCVIRALDRSGITSNTRVSPPLRTAIMSRCQEHGNRHGTVVCTHVTMLQSLSFSCCQSGPVKIHTATNSGRTNKLIIIIIMILKILVIISSDVGHLPEILVHRFEEEFVAVDRSIVEDIFKIR